MPRSTVRLLPAPKTTCTSSGTRNQPSTTRGPQWWLPHDLPSDHIDVTFHLLSPTLRGSSSACLTLPGCRHSRNSLLFSDASRIQPQSPARAHGATPGPVRH